jgi:hypothetical protein
MTRIKKDLKQEKEPTKEKDKKKKYNPIDPPELKHAPKTDISINLKDDSLKELIEKNIKWSQVIYEQNKKIKRRMGWMVFVGYLKIVLILAPIIFALIYLSPHFKQIFEQYSSLLGSGGATSLLEQSGLPINEILGEVSNDQLQEFLQKLQK